MAKIKSTFKVTIQVDTKKVKQNYPNYKSNFSTPDEFINFIVENIKSTVSDTDEFGYNVKFTKISHV